MSQGAKSPAAPLADKSKGSGIPTEAGWYVLGARAPEGRELPRQSITFGGQSFPRWCQDENPKVTPSTIEYNQRRRGQRVYLDEEDLKNLRAAMGKKIVRVRSEKSGSAFILKTDSKLARRKLNGDLPLERFIYIEPSNAPEEDLSEDGDDTLFPVG